MSQSERREGATTDAVTLDARTQVPPAAAPGVAVLPNERSHSPSRAQLLDALGTEASGHIGGYRLVELIGEGAMGHVYRAEHVLLGRLVAIKMLLPELARDESATARFLAEARFLNQIEHQHVIDVTDFTRDANGTPWFVMELLEGSDLGALITSGPIPLRRSLELVRQLCAALTAVHAAGIVHRDVKPENTFVSTRDGEDFVKLIDFGIARLPDAAHADPPMLAKEGLAGTASYMAPEQVSFGPLDFRLDLYAVGGVLFELVVGYTPFRREDMRVLLRDVLFSVPPVPSSLVFVPEAIRVDLDKLILSCLAKEPAKRPRSARAIAAVLTDLTRRLDMPARASFTPPLRAVLTRPARGERARRWLGALAVGVMMSLITASAGDAAGVHIASPVSTPAAAQAPAAQAKSLRPAKPKAVVADAPKKRSAKEKRAEKAKPATKNQPAPPDRDVVLNPFKPRSRQ